MCKVAGVEHCFKTAQQKILAKNKVAKAKATVSPYFGARDFAFALA